VEIRRIEEVADYAAAIIGAPLIMGWQRAATKFVKKHRDTLDRVRWLTYSWRAV
jgi:menaquinone-dependent protoporphyrinogen IX oxidase